MESIWPLIPRPEFLVPTLVSLARGFGCERLLLEIFSSWYGSSIDNPIVFPSMLSNMPFMLGTQAVMMDRL